MIVLGIVVYFIIGYWLARTAAAYTNQKLFDKRDLRAGEIPTWTSNFWTWLWVITLPVLWPIQPLLWASSVLFKNLNYSANYAGRELANPKKNLKEID